MSTVESILEQVKTLSPDEQVELAKRLFDKLEMDADAEEVAIGLRGLAALTESTRGEGWSMYYPPQLRRQAE